MTTILDNGQTRTFPGSSLTFDIAPYPGEFSFDLHVTKLSPNAVAVFQLQDSADNFVSDIQTVKTFSVNGEIQTLAPWADSVHKYQMESIRMGVAGRTGTVLSLKRDGWGECRLYNRTRHLKKFQHRYGVPPFPGARLLEEGPPCCQGGPIFSP